MDTSTRLPGHGLLSEGWPYERRQGDEEDAPSWHKSPRPDWSGHGVCSCGASSPLLETNNARKRWHRAHKEEVRTGRPPQRRERTRPCLTRQIRQPPPSSPSGTGPGSWPSSVRRDREAT